MDSTTIDIECNLRELLEDEEQQHTGESKEKYWSRARTKLLIIKRLELETSFKQGKKKRTFLWNKILREIKLEDPTFPFAVDDIMRKFHNLMTTYKRSKEKAGRSGEGRVLWEFYEEFDSVYGNKHSITPPEDITIASLATSGDKGSINSPAQNSDEGSDSSEALYGKKRRTSSNKEVLDFLRMQYEREEKRLKEQEEKEDARIQGLLKLEREKIEVEKEKTKAILELKDVITHFMK